MSIEIRGMTADEADEHNELCYVAYSEYHNDRPFLQDRAWFGKREQADPYWRPEMVRCLFIDGRMVCAADVYTRTMHVAGRTAKAGCIGAVATHPDFRRQGLLKQLLAEVKDFMRRDGYTFSFLFGLEEVYGGSGWEMFSAFEIVTNITVRADVASGLSERPVETEADFASLRSLYDQTASRLTGPIARNEAYWRDWIFGAENPAERMAQFVLLERSGEPVAYFRKSGEAGASEIGWRQDDAEALRALATHLACRLEKREGRFSFFLPELCDVLREVSDVPNRAAAWSQERYIKLVEAYKGLWMYVGDPDGQFPEFSDTPSLKRFLRASNYAFWGSADSF